MTFERRYYTVREASDITGLSPDTLRRLMRQHRLEYCRPSPRCTRILASSLEQLMRPAL